VFAKSRESRKLKDMRRGELNDEQWERLQPLLPAQKPRTGRPNLDHRQVVNGILWILRTGAPWRDLPERYGKWPTVSSRFYRWREAGIWDRVWAQLQSEADEQEQIDWQVHFLDGTVVRAHQHAAGAKKQVPRPKRWAAAKVDLAPKSTCGLTATDA
jgi:transposase